MDNEGLVYAKKPMIGISSDWVFNNAEYNSNTYRLIVHPGGTASINIKYSKDLEATRSQILKTTKKFKLAIVYESLDNVYDNYSNTGCVFKTFIVYSIDDENSSIDNIVVNINNAKMTNVENVYTADSIIDLQGYRLEDLTFKIYNNSESDLILRRADIFPAYRQYDLDVITEVSKFESVQADVAAVNSIYANNLMAEQIETNFDALNPNKPYSSVREYIEVFDNVMKFMYSDLSADEYTDYIVDGSQVYWTDVNPRSENYMKYFTLTDPVLRERNPESLNEDEKEMIRERFRVKVRKSSNVGCKLKICYASVPGEDNVPILVFGAGSGVVSQYSSQFVFNDADDQNLYTNQGLIWKDKNGLYAKYITENDEMIDAFGSGSSNIEWISAIQFVESSSGVLLGFNIETESGAFAEYQMIYNNGLSAIYNKTLDKTMIVSTVVNS